MSCGNHARHWFSLYGMPGFRSPVCVRGCGQPNPTWTHYDTGEWFYAIVEATCRQVSPWLAAESCKPGNPFSEQATPDTLVRALKRILHDDCPARLVPTVEHQLKNLRDAITANLTNNIPRVA